MANPVIVDIPGIGPVEAKNAATEQTLRDILKAMQAVQKNTSAGGAGGKGGAGGAGGGGAGGAGGGGAGGALGKGTSAVSKGMGSLATKLTGVANVAGQVAMKFLEIGSASAQLIKEFSNIGDDLENAASSLGKIPVVGGALATTFGAVAQASQKSAKAFQDAASAGASFGGSMNNFIRTASQAGMTMDQFSSLIRSNGVGMLGFGATVEEGSKRFGQVSKALRSSSSDLYALGFSTQDINEGLANYGKLMRLTGRSQNMTTEQLAQGAKSYLKELDALAKITGEDRKTQEAKMEALAKDAQYQAMLSTKDEKVRKSFDALMSQTPAELQGFVKDFITTGTATTEESGKIAALMGTEVMAELQSYHQKLNRGEALTVQERNRMNNLLAEGSKKVMAQYGNTLAANRDMDGATKAVVAGLKLQKDGVIKAEEEQAAAAQSQEKLNETVERAKAKLAELSNSFTQVLLNSGMLDSLMSVFGTLANIVTAFVVPAFKIFGAILKPIVWFISSVLDPVVKALGDRINMILQPFNYVGYMLDKVSGDFNLVSAAVNVLLIPFNLITGAMSLLWKGFLAVADTVEDVLSPVFSFFGRMIGDVSKIFKDTFNPIIDGTAKWFKDTFRGLMGALSPVINPVVDAFKATKKAIGDFFNSFNSIGDVITSLKFAFRSLGLNLKEMWYAIKDFIPGLKDATPEERAELAAEKEQLLLDRAGHDQKLQLQMQENQKKEEDRQRARDRARAERDKSFYDNKEAREQSEADRKKAAEAEAAGGVNWADPASTLRHHYQGMKQPGAQTQPAAGISIPTDGKLGAMAAKFESGRAGSAAVGWDSTGGTSFGKYQIATKTGTMDKFMQHLKETNPEAFARLSKAGPADSGKDGAFAQEWKKLAGEGKLQQSEHEFIKKTHFDKGVAGLKDKNLQDMIGKSKALQEVMWSTSVQHGGGGASGIFNKVYKEGMSEQDLIKSIYAERGQRFGSSTAQVRASVQNRFAQEQQMALGLAGQPGTTTLAANPEINKTVASLAKPDAQAAQASQTAGNKAQQAAGGPSKPMAPAQESAESLLASLNSKMDQLIAVNRNLGDLNERQLRVQKSLSTDGYMAA